MRVIIGADHRGFRMKEAVKEWLVAKKHAVEDAGAASFDPNDDYPDYGAAVGRLIAADSHARGIVFCGSGAGIAIAADKISGVRAVSATEPRVVHAARHDDNANVLAISADFTPEDMAKILISIFLETRFGAEKRYFRRIEKIKNLEHEN